MFKDSDLKKKTYSDVSCVSSENNESKNGRSGNKQREGC